MELLEKLFDLIAKTPDWVCLYLFPALLLAAAVGFIFAPQRRWYYCVAAPVSAAGTFIMYAKSKTVAVLYLGLAIALCGLLSLLFLIPASKRAEKNLKQSRMDAMYEKFHEELSEKSYAPRAAMPPKVCCFERDAKEGVRAEESGMSFGYADALLNKLRAKELSAGDRLEIEELSHRLDYYRSKPLTEAERSTLNDCLATILKFTAKYQL